MSSRLLRSISVACCSMFLAGTLPAAAQSYARTVVVSPVPDDPLASGQELLAAVAGIPNPRGTDPWLVKIEPGIYDLGDGSLAMRQWVDVEGSGATVIRGHGRGDVFGGTVVGASHAELRELTVETDGVGLAAAVVGVYLPAVDTRLHRVRVVSRNGVEGTDAIFIRNGSPKLSAVEVVAWGSAFASGIVIDGSAKVAIADSTIEVSGATSTNRGILVQEACAGSEPLMRGVRITVSGGEKAYGIVGRYLVQPEPMVIDSTTIRVSGGKLENAGVIFTKGTGLMRLLGCRIDALGAKSYGVWSKVGGASVTVAGSEVSGETATVAGIGASVVSVSSTLLKGGPAGEGAVCAGVTDEDFVFYPNDCP